MHRLVGGAVSVRNVSRREASNGRVGDGARILLSLESPRDLLDIYARASGPQVASSQTVLQLAGPPVLSRALSSLDVLTGVVHVAGVLLAAAAPVVQAIGAIGARVELLHGRSSRQCEQRRSSSLIWLSNHCFRSRSRRPGRGSADSPLPRPPPPRGDKGLRMLGLSGISLSQGRELVAAPRFQCARSLLRRSGKPKRRVPGTTSSDLSCTAHRSKRSRTPGLSNRRSPPRAQRVVLRWVWAQYGHLRAVSDVANVVLRPRRN
jgi:hypothetical protein